VAVNPDLTIRYADVDEDYQVVLATTPPEDDGPVWMVNLMHYREVADYADGRSTTLTGQEADDLYAPFDAMEEVGAELVFLAGVQQQLLGDAPTWDRVAVVKYPSRRAFVDMSMSPTFAAKHVHKDAGMARTIVMGCRPMPPPDLPDDLPDWKDVPHPPTADDGPIVILHVLRFHDTGAAGEMEDYQQAAGKVAVPHGVRVVGWFGVEGTILGDGRQWDQCRFNTFPSLAAFMAVAMDAERTMAQSTHREAAVDDTYTMLLRPVIDRLTASLDG
jgi:uncharacterized protein (DUF1330 family)